MVITKTIAFEVTSSKLDNRIVFGRDKIFVVLNSETIVVADIYHLLGISCRTVSAW